MGQGSDESKVHTLRARGYPQSIQEGRGSVIDEY